MFAPGVQLYYMYTAALSYPNGSCIADPNDRIEVHETVIMYPTSSFYLPIILKCSVLTCTFRVPGGCIYIYNVPGPVIRGQSLTGVFC